MLIHETSIKPLHQMKKKTFISKKNFTKVIKHPLENDWTLWYYHNDRNNTWENNLKIVSSFNTVEDFWRLYHNIKRPSELKQGCDYSIFKKGIKPMWEDERNKRGGRWLISLDKQQRATDLDVYWLEILLFIIGETLTHSEQLCGVTVNIRAKGDKIGLWTSDANDTKTVMAIGEKLRDALKLVGNTIIGYQIHKEAIESNLLSDSNYAHIV